MSIGTIRNNTGARAALALLAAGAATILLSPGAAPLDDTYIHLVFGRNLLRGSFMEFNPGEPSTGLTSPLWIVPSTAAALAGGLAPDALMCLSLVAAAAAILVSGSAAPLLLLTGPLLFHASSGMETALAALLAVAITMRLSKGGGRDLTLGILLALASITRPEMAVLCLPAALGTGRRPCALAARLLPPALAMASWGVWNLAVSGSILPSTFYAKASQQTLEALPSLLARLFLSAPLALPAALAGAAAMARRRNPAWACFPLLAAAALATQPNHFNQLRYHVPWLCAAMPPAAFWIGSCLKERWRKTALVSAVLLMLPGAAFFARQRVRAADDVLHMDVLPAMLVDSLASPGEAVAAGDIGAMAWFTGMRVIDLDGLVTPQRLPGPGAAGWDWIGPRAGWLAAFPGQYSDLVEEAGDDLRFVGGFSSPSPVICGEDTVAVWRVSRCGPPLPRGSGPW